MCIASRAHCYTGDKFIFVFISFVKSDFVWALESSKFLLAIGAAGEHSVNHADYEKSKATMELVRGREMLALFKDMGKVEDRDTYARVMEKIVNRTKAQTNQW